MFKLKTYRSRLILHVAVLAIFLSLTVYAASYYTRSVLVEEADANTRRTARLIDTHIQAQHNELRRYATIISSDLQLQEYMYIVNSVGSDAEPLDRLFSRQFNWLPVTSANLVNSRGEILAGSNSENPVNIAPLLNSTEASTSYEYSDGKLRLVAVNPVYYRQARLGLVVLNVDYDRALISTLEQQSNGHLFVVRDGTIVSATDTQLVGAKFDRYDRRLSVDSHTYMLQRINLPGYINTPGLELWYATSETLLFDHLAQFNKITLLFILLGASGIMALGTVLLRNFDRPLRELAAMTDTVALGGLPDAPRQKERNEIDSLSNKFIDMVQSLRDKQTEIDATQQQLQSLVITDTLTGLYNRRHLLELFPKLLAEAQRNKKHIGAVLLDIDHFKQINDRYGHLCGDHCLREFTDILRKNSRSNDFLFRIGGEEFLILTLGETGRGLQHLAEKIRKHAERHVVHFEEHLVNMTVSCGIAYIDPEGFETEMAMNTLLKFADNAMYQAKHGGRNRTMVLESIAVPRKNRPQTPSGNG